MKYIIILLFLISSCFPISDETIDKAEVIDSLLINSVVHYRGDTFDIIETRWFNSIIVLENHKEYNFKYIKRYLPKDVINKLDSIKINHPG